MLSNFDLDKMSRFFSNEMLQSQKTLNSKKVTFIPFSEMKNCVYFQVWLFMSSDEVVVESCHATKK